MYRENQPMEEGYEVLSSAELETIFYNVFFLRSFFMKLSKRIVFAKKINIENYFIKTPRDA